MDNPASNSTSPESSKDVLEDPATWSPRYREDIERLPLTKPTVQASSSIPKQIFTSKPSNNGAFEDPAAWSPRYREDIERLPPIKATTQTSSPKQASSSEPMQASSSQYCVIAAEPGASFLNSCMQMFFTVPELRQTVLSNPSAGPLYGAMAKLFGQMAFRTPQQEEEVSIKELLAILLSLRPDLTSVSDDLQKNSLDLPMELLEMAQSEAKDDKLCKLFSLQVKQQYCCNMCKSEQSLDGLGWGIIFIVLPTKKFAPTLKECFEAHIDTKQFVENYCENCHKKQPTVYKRTVKTIPSYLLVALRREPLSISQKSRLGKIDEQFQLIGYNFFLQCAILHDDVTFSALVRESAKHWTLVSDSLVQCNIKRSEAMELLESNSCVLLLSTVPVSQIPKDLIKDNDENGFGSTAKESFFSGASRWNGQALVGLTQPAGHCGLYNLGLTCYANSGLQALFACRQLRARLIAHQEIGPFHKLLGELFEKMQANAEAYVALDSGPQQCKSIAPRDFLKEFRQAKPIFKAHQMADAQEFFSILIELLHQEDNRAKKKEKKEVKADQDPKSAQEAWDNHLENVDQSFLSDCVLGQLECTLFCCTCAHKSFSWPCFWQLQLDIPSSKNSSIVDCIGAFQSDETLTDENAPLCSSSACSNSRQPAIKLTKICRAPRDYLIVHLKRFASNQTKNTEKVVLDQHIELCKKNFVLVCAVTHQGPVLTSGHNSTIVRMDTNEWAQLNDDICIKGLSAEAVAKDLNHNAYLCFYLAK